MNPGVQEIFPQAASRGFYIALVTGLQIVNYYNQFGDVEVSFNKDVIRATGLQTRNNLIKCKGAYWPCFVYSSSMRNAKIVASVKEDFHKNVKEANNLVTLQIAFQIPDKAAPIIIRVSAKLGGIAKYGEESSGLSLITLNYTQQPADDLISILGQLLESNLNSQKRKEERIIINDAVIRKLGLKSKNIIIAVDNIPRKAMLRDLSFSGTKLIIAGIAKFLVNKAILVQLEAADTGKKFNLPGKILRFEPIENRKDIAAIAVQFDETKVPIEYKIFFNEFITRKGPGKQTIETTQ